MRTPPALAACIGVAVLTALAGVAIAQSLAHALRPHPAAVPNTHAPGEVDRPELVPFIVADPAKLPGIVMDETAATLVGKWQYSTHTPPYVGLGYLHDMKDGKGEKSVIFTPDLPRAAAPSPPRAALRAPLPPTPTSRTPHQTPATQG